MQTNSSEARRHSMVGILLMFAGVACLSVNDAFAKALTAQYSTLQVLFLRNVIALPFAFAVAYWMGGTGALRTYRPAAHLLRGVLWICAAMLFFTSFRYLRLAEATALIFVAPMFITALSALMLREQVGWRRWVAVTTGFVGVLIVARPGGSSFQPASMLPVVTALLYAFLLISARWVDSRESVWTLLLYLTGAGALLSGLIVPFVWSAVRAEDVWLFVGIALFGTAGMTMMTQAFRLAPASVVAPIDYSALLWATGFGWLIWNEIPDLATYVGAVVIIASGIYIVLRERRVEDQGPDR